MCALHPPGPSHGGDGDGVSKVPHNTWAPQSRVEWCHGLVGWGEHVFQPILDFYELMGVGSKVDIPSGQEPYHALFNLQVMSAWLSPEDSGQALIWNVHVLYDRWYFDNYNPVENLE